MRSGEDLVKNVKTSGLETICIPGPCAALTALVSSGMAASKFTFEGFLPKRKIDRNKILFEISQNNKTTILFESLIELILLEELKENCGGDREIQVFRELTKSLSKTLGYN